MELILQPFQFGRLGDRLKAAFSKHHWTSFRAAIAFVKRSGTRHVAPDLAALSQTADVEIIVGIDHGGTSSEGLRDLLSAISPKGRVIVFHNPLPFTFHPKIYLFRSSSVAELMIGSGNLTEGGLFSNYEAGLHISLDLADSGDAAVLSSVEQALNSWADLSSGTALLLDDLLLAQLGELGLVPSEATSADRTAGGRSPPQTHESPFAARSEPGAPSFHPRGLSPAQSIDEAGSPEDAHPGVPSPSARQEPLCFVMTLHLTDVGHGQTTAGTSRRSPEIFIPLVARDAHPGFWGWPDAFQQDPDKPGKRDRYGVRVRLGDEIVDVNMMTWPDKYDFRLRSEPLRSAGNVGDILRMEKTAPSSGCEYEIKIIRQDTEEYSTHLDQCRESVRNSQKKYGYY